MPSILLPRPPHTVKMHFNSIGHLCDSWPINNIWLKESTFLKERNKLFSIGLLFWAFIFCRVFLIIRILSWNSYYIGTALKIEEQEKRIDILKFFKVEIYFTKKVTAIL